MQLKKEIINNIDIFMKNNQLTFDKIKINDRSLFEAYLKKKIFYKCWENKETKINKITNLIIDELTHQQRFFFIKNFLNKIIEIFIFDIFKNREKNKKIGVTFSEGIIYNHKNDLFFSSYKNYKNIIYFAEVSLSNFFFILKKKIEYKKKRINLKLLPIFFITSKYKKYDYPRYSFINFFYLNYELFKKRKDFYIKYFKNYNIKILYDSTELSQLTPIKKIAINNLGGITFGKTRSYPDQSKYEFYYYYFCDIFFCWGSEDIINHKKKFNFINNYLNTGILIKPHSDKFLTDLKRKYKRIITIFDTNFKLSNKDKDKFNILLSKDDYGKYMKEIINNLKYLNNDDLIIIKTKKNNKVNHLEKITRFTKQNIMILSEINGYTPSDLAKISYITISFQKTLSSAFIESLKYCNNSFFFCSEKLKLFNYTMYNKIFDRKIIFFNLNSFVNQINDITKLNFKLTIKNKNYLNKIHKHSKVIFDIEKYIFSLLKKI